MSGLSILRRLALVAVLGAASLTACTSASSGNGYTFTSATKLGTVVPVKDRKAAQDISASQLSGAGTTTLTSFAGHVLVVNFWATWCAPCATETPQFDSLYRRVKGQGIDFLGVDTKNAPRGLAQRFVQQNDISYPMVYDELGKVLLKLGNIPSGGLPLTVLIDKKQRVAAAYIGRLAPKDLEPVLTTLNAES